ncbi:MAG: flippase-like domain-containing protein, partial [Methanobrevibacter sp.]|nr:flippase-like domain-containing protein [Methanobrevibacter sp.]
LLPGGLGAVDGIMIIFYSAAGITASISAAATVIERLISFWMATILGLVILPYYGSSVLDKISIGSSDEIEESSKEE